MTYLPFNKHHLFAIEDQTSPSLAKLEQTQIPDLALVKDKNRRFRLVRGKKGIVRVDVQKAREALKHTMKKHAQFFET
jgi:hypothetical protein